MAPSLTTRRLPHTERGPRVSGVRTLFHAVRDVREQLDEITKALCANFERVQAISTHLAANEVKQDYLNGLIEDLRHDNSLLRMHTQQRDDTIALLHRRMAILEEQIERAELALRSSERSDESVHCLCCFAPTTDYIRCDGQAAHAFCNDCVETQCRVTRSNPCSEPASDMQCMSTEECVGRLCSMTEHGEKIRADYYVQQAMRHVIPMCTEASAVRLSLMRSDGTFRGLQCRACGYGPLWNENCSELITHHAQRSEGGGQIDNTCPQCGSFVRDTALMSQWNGAVHRVIVDDGPSSSDRRTDRP